MNAQTMYWSVRRELWENRGLYIVPSTVAAVVIFASLISTLAARLRHNTSSHYDFAALVLMGTTFIVSIFYCLDAIYGERRDRSTLFWKSMPVSDVTTVLSKMAVPVVILPVLTFVITAATQLLMLLLDSAALLAQGQGPAPWAAVIGSWPMLLWHLTSGHGLYYAPIFAWLLLVSAWARRMPFLWAFIPLIAIGVLEKIAFNTSHFGHVLGSRMSGGMEPMKGEPMLGHFHPIDFLLSPGLWIGLAIAAAFLALAVWLRRVRGPI